MHETTYHAPSPSCSRWGSGPRWPRYPRPSAPPSSCPPPATEPVPSEREHTGQAHATRGEGRHGGQMGAQLECSSRRDNGHQNDAVAVAASLSRRDVMAGRVPGLSGEHPVHRRDVPRASPASVAAARAAAQPRRHRRSHSSSPYFRTKYTYQSTVNIK